MDEQHQEIIRFLHDYGDHMREVARDSFKQALFGGAGAILGTILFTRLLGKKIGVWGGVLGAVLGSVIGYMNTSDYDEQVETLTNLSQADKKKLVDSICQILKTKGKLDSTQVLKVKGAMKEAFFEVTKQSTVSRLLENLLFVLIPSRVLSSTCPCIQRAAP